MDDSLGPPGSPRSPPGSMWPSGSSTPMSSGQVLREAQRIIWNIEALSTTPLKDMQEISLVELSIDSKENDQGGTPCGRLFPEEAPVTANNPMFSTEENSPQQVQRQGRGEQGVSSSNGCAHELICTCTSSPEARESPPSNSVATPESPLMSPSMVIAEAQSAVWELEALATTPLVDTSPISLVDVSLDSLDSLDANLPSFKSIRRKLFEDEPVDTTVKSCGEEAAEAETEFAAPQFSLARDNSETSEFAAQMSCNLVGDASPDDNYLNRQYAVSRSDEREARDVAEPPYGPVTLRPGDEFSRSYHVHESVGRGRFGVVHRCTRLADGSEAAARVARCTRAAERDRVRNELAILNLLRGQPQLLQLLEAYETPREIVLVTEYVAGGELFQRVIADDFVLTERECVLFVRQICAGMAYMHKKQIVHLDLKPENILCQSQVGRKIKLIDFGMAQLYKPNLSLGLMFGTSEFVAPEIVSYDPVSPATDMWSVGVICYLLISGLSPFVGDSDTDTFKNIAVVDFDFDDAVFKNISAVAKDFMRRLIMKNPRKRMSADICLQHEWLRNVTKRGASSLPLPTDKLKQFVARRKWLKSGERPAAQADEPCFLLACEEEAPVSPSPSDMALAIVEQAICTGDDN